MATKHWTGLRQPSAQVEVITFTGVGGTGETITITIGGRVVTYTRVSGETTTTLAEALVALLSSSTFPEITEVTPASSGAVLTLTGQPTGQPFTLALADSGGGSPITWTLSSTAAKSPNHVGDAANYSGGTLPSAGDELILSPGTPDLKYQLDHFASTAITITRLAGGPRIGLPNANETNGYAEYRRRRFQSQSTSAKIETSQNDQPGAIRLEFTGSSAATVTVLGNADPGVGGEPVEIWDLPNNSSVRCNGSGVRVLDEDSVAATGIVVNVQNSSTIISSRATCASVSLYNANAIIRGVVTGQYLQESASKVDFYGSVDTSTGSVVVDEGELNWITNANIVNLDIGSNGIVSLSSGAGAVAVTGEIQRHEGGILRDPNSRLTVPYSIDLVRSELSDDLDIGTHRRITVDAIS